MLYAFVQVEFLGSQWGTMSVYKYYTNDADPSKSDAIVYFSNTSPAIPSGALPILRSHSSCSKIPQESMLPGLSPLMPPPLDDFIAFSVSKYLTCALRLTNSSALRVKQYTACRRVWQL